MAAALEAALKINDRWLNCLHRSHVQLADCPSNEQVAEIISDHFDDELAEIIKNNIIKSPQE